MSEGTDLARVSELSDEIRKVVEDDDIDVVTLALAHEAFNSMVYFGLQCGELHNTHDLKRLMNGFLDKYIEARKFPLQREYNRSFAH